MDIWKNKHSTSGGVYHILMRGNGGQVIFFSKKMTGCDHLFISMKVQNDFHMCFMRSFISLII